VLPVSTKGEDDIPKQLESASESNGKCIMKVEARFSRVGTSDRQLNFHRGEVVEILVHRPNGKVVSPTSASSKPRQPTPPSTRALKDILPANDPFPSSAKPQVKRVRALHCFQAISLDQLSFKKGDVLGILIYKPTGNWWFAKLEGKNRWIPVKVIGDDETNTIQSPASHFKTVA
jgi:hypothetical protein